MQHYKAVSRSGRMSLIFHQICRATFSLISKVDFPHTGSLQFSHLMSKEVLAMKPEEDRTSDRSRQVLFFDLLYCWFDWKNYCCILVVSKRLALLCYDFKIVAVFLYLKSGKPRENAQDTYSSVFQTSIESTCPCMQSYARMWGFYVVKQMSDVGRGAE